MHFSTRFTLALAARAATTWAATPAQPAAGIPRDSEPQATSVPAKLETRARRPAYWHNDMSRYQKVLTACPENVGPDGPMACGLCGGENPDKPGFCNQKNRFGVQCNCGTVNEDGVTTSVVTTEVDGEYATATFELDTLTQYSALRERITVTNTMTTTATDDGDSGIETVIAVVLAGGVAWFLADATGATGALAAIEPPSEARDHDDDKSCPDPEQECKNCGGKDGICTQGDSANCACQETCPAEGAQDQPVCSNEDECDGNDQQICTVGEHKDCKCKMPDCPNLDEYHVYCDDDCGGKGDDGKCKGWSDDRNIFQGCACRDPPDYSKAPSTLNRPDYSKHKSQLSSLPDIKFPSSSDLPEPTCDKDKSGQIQYNSWPIIYKSFCDSINGGKKSDKKDMTVNAQGQEQTPSSKAKREIASVFGRTPPPNPNGYQGFTIDLHWTGGDDSCYSDCATVMDKISTSVCGHLGGQQNAMAQAGSLDTGCGIYSYNINIPEKFQPDPAPPTRREWDIKCTDSTVQTKFTRDQAIEAVNDFCSHDITLLDMALPAFKVYKKDGVTLQLSTQWSRSGQDGCAPVDVRDPHLTKDECSLGFMTAVDSCNTDSATDKFGAKPVTWGGPKGCIDFNIYGDGADWECPTLGVIPDQCTNPPKGSPVP